MQGPHVVIEGLPAGRALRRPLLRGPGRGPGGHWERDGAVGEHDRLRAQGRIDGVKGLVMRGEDLVQGFPEILQQMKPVCHLGGRGRALAVG